MAKATLTIDIDHDREERLEALDAFVQVWGDDMLLSHIGESLTCTEAEALASLLRAAGRPAASEGLIDAHSYGDDEGDMHYGG